MRRFWRWSSKGFIPAEPQPGVASLVSGDAELGRHDSFLILPPLWDHHGHVLAMGALSEEADLRGARSVEEALSLVRERAKSTPKGSWLLGFGWDHNLWGGVFPPLAGLDEASGGHPAYLRRIDGHAAWANSAALARAGLRDDSADPPGGRLMRESGRLTGIVMDNAMARIEAAMPPPEEDVLCRRAIEALRELKALGLCGVTDMGLCALEAKLFANLDAKDALPIQVRAYLREDPRAWSATWNHRGKAFRVEGAKLFCDGSLGSRTAALFEEYADDPENSGLLLLSRANLSEMLAAARRHGISLAIHAIGDRAAGTILDAIESEASPHNVRIEHCQVIADGQAERMARLGVTASVQPCHWLSDKAWAPLRLGEKRMGRAYRLGSLARAGIPVLMGTDFPIEKPDPRRTIFSALARPEPERLSFGATLASMAPPQGAIPPKTVTLAAGAAPEDLMAPERLLSWTLRQVEVEDSP
ncbi:MAG: amidohydrolase [Acidobacteria bacterium]|nr:amidohydrolase [Acidobacteriota bacterium]